MNSLLNYKYVCLLGIGGIGMSALARFFSAKGVRVCGYDLTKSEITQLLEDAGAKITYSDELSLFDKELTSANTLVIYTPAVPKELRICKYVEEKGFTIMKRAEVLGEISRMYKTLAVAGTHGKTSVSTLLAHIMYCSDKQCLGILGGVSLNYNSNLLLPTQKTKWMVTEADEFDRSFLQLSVQKAIITAVDADHLDIYLNYENLKQAYRDFVDRIEQGGVLITKPELTWVAEHRKDLKIYTYSANVNSQADLCPTRIEKHGLGYSMDVKTPIGLIENIKFNIPGEVNIENTVAAIAVASLSEATSLDISRAVASFLGVHRRFQIVYSAEDMVYIDDYAHHPEEVRATLNSVRKYFPDKNIVGIFQPHLFSRTRDFADDFAECLNLLDKCYLLDIYPAREKPVDGVTSALIANKMLNKDIKIVDKSEILSIVEELTNSVLLTIGAGDIGKEAPKILSLLHSR
ncbi:MAG: UDP-N-acetylmuramate--L-alanine ligase [Bacteroidales bacterium]